MIRDIYELYRRRSEDAGNITEHLPLLYSLSLQSEGVAEFGVEHGVSTSALIAGQSKRRQLRLPAGYDGYDITPACESVIDRLASCCIEPVRCNFHRGSAATAQPVACGLLFIDSLHNAETVQLELQRHLHGVKRYVAFHDTVTYGEVGEKGGPGLLYGMQLVTNSPDWVLLYDSPRNNGMAVFIRRELLK